MPDADVVQEYCRRHLPEHCVDFASEEGKRLFTDALLSGWLDFWFGEAVLISGSANIFFKLASQFRTQDDMNYCGVSTLGNCKVKGICSSVMVLNALNVDPQRVWKPPYRFYHESMLDSCLPIAMVC